MGKIALMFAALSLANVGLAAQWKPAPGHFPMTRWAKDVSPDKLLPEYPRPQMVWLEPVAENYIQSLRIIPDLDASTISVACRASTNGQRPTDNVRVQVLDGGKPVAAAMGKAGEVIQIKIMDAHCYGTTRCISPTKQRASVIGEYGYAKYLDSIPKYRPLVNKPGVSGLVWTQLTDVENERNGLLSYDRGKFSEDPKQVAAQNAAYDGREHR